RYCGCRFTPLVWMSRSATPADFSAASTRFICPAFSRMAALPSAAWVTTPAEMVAMSGAWLASAWAWTESRVESAAIGGTTPWAEAGVAMAKASGSESIEANRLRIAVDLLGNGGRGPAREDGRQGPVVRMNAP